LFRSRYSHYINAEGCRPAAHENIRIRKGKKYRFNYSVRATIESELRKDTDIFTENH